MPSKVLEPILSAGPLARFPLGVLLFFSAICWPLLATTASAAPFIGLFGTIIGIMSAFHGIGQQGSASLAVVAPGISEALIATAAGLGAAIPAVMGYNFYVNRVKRWAVEMDGFALELLNVFARPAPAKAASR